jgi:hypothetical protein
MRVRHRSPSPRLASLALAALVFLAAASTASASERADPSEADAPRSAARVENGSEKVCRRVRPVGSNIPQTICRTRQQMADEQAAARDALDSRARQD